MVARSGMFAMIIGSALAAGSVGLLARKRRKLAQKNPAGLADANLSPEERRDATADYQRRRAEEQARGG